MIVLDWHGWRAALDKDGASKWPPRGLEMEDRAQVTHLGVPMHHAGGEPHMVAIQSGGFHVVRTLEPPWRVDRDGPYHGQAGKALLEFQSPIRPGKFLEGFAAALRPPCVGIGWNIETDPYEYPVTAEDEVWGQEAGLNPEDRASFRCARFSLLVRLYRAAAEMALGVPLMSYVFCLYGGIEVSGKDSRTGYSVDWELLGRPVAYRGRTYRRLDFAVPAWAGESLPDSARTAPGLRNLHCVGLPEDEDAKRRWRAYEAALADRIKRARTVPGDGLALVACSPLSGPWNAQEDRLRTIVARLVRSKS